MENHPDKAPDESKEAYEARFKEISNAHEVLADPQKRSLYDAYGPSLQPPEPEFNDELGLDELSLLFEAMLRARPPCRPPPEEPDAKDIVQSIGLIGGGIFLCWFCSRWSSWFWWRWRFFVFDLMGS